MKKKKENNKIQTIMMGFIAFILITSVMGFIWKGGSPPVEYKEIPFIQEANGWSVDIKGQNVFFNYHPEEVEYINLTSTITQRLTAIEIDTTYDLDDEYVEFIARVQYSMAEGLGNFDIFLVSGFTTENEFNRQVITCNDATPFVPVIYFKKSNRI